MILIPAGEVSSGQLSEFFSGTPDGEQAFLKENVRDPEIVAAWRGPGSARRQAAMNKAGTLVGVVSMIPEFGWSDHMSQLRLLVHRSPGSRRELVTLVALARDQRPQVRLAAALT